jgi:isoleucyl-tRNA synthetase
VQTVLEELLQALVRILVPVTPHLAEDIWQHIPEKIKTAGSHEMSVLMTDYPVPNPDYYNQKLETFWTEMINVRGTVNKALEQARASRQIGSSLEAQVLVTFDDAALSDRVAALGSRLPSIFITSQATVPTADGGSGNGAAPAVLAEVNENGMKVKVLKAQGEKCPRCWKYSTKIGIDAAFPDLCNDCAEAVGATT